MLGLIPLLLNIETITKFVQLGLTTAQAVAEQVRAGRAAVRTAGDHLLTAEEVVSHVDAALMRAADVAAHAEHRIEGRHPD